jgi:hypothetical protein
VAERRLSTTATYSREAETAATAVREAVTGEAVVEEAGGGGNSETPYTLRRRLGAGWAHAHPLGAEESWGGRGVLLVWGNTPC